MTTPSDPTPPAAAPVSYWDAPKEEVGPAPGIKFAGHGSRLVAYIIDSLILLVIYVVVFSIASIAFVGAAATSVDFTTGIPNDIPTGFPTPAVAGAIGLFGILFVLSFVIAFAYFPFFWARSGQTPGMRPFGLYVVRDSDGGKITVGAAVLRLIGMWVSAIPVYLGFIWIFIDPRRRGWHDLIAGTVVIERPQQR